MGFLTALFFFLFIISFLSAVLCGVWAHTKSQQYKEYGSVDEFRRNTESKLNEKKTDLESFRDKLSDKKKQLENELAEKRNNLVLQKKKFETDLREQRKQWDQDKSDAKDDLENVKNQIANEQAELSSVKTQVGATQAQLESIRSESGAALELVDLTVKIEKARSELSTAINSVELESIGIFDRVFENDDPEFYRESIRTTISHRKAMVKDKVACICQTDWVVAGSQAEGKKMTDRAIKLMLRAFNGECSAAIAKVTAANYATQ